MKLCKFCEHTEPDDLIQVVDEDWQFLFWRCEDTFWCDVRAVARGIDHGEHLGALA